MTPYLVFRDPYLLDFLGLADTYCERDLEAAILRELERFLLELCTDFSFIARQKRMTMGERDFYLDLLFYRRSLRRLVAIELKLGSFDAAYKGQMELYLRWRDNTSAGLERSRPLGLSCVARRTESRSSCSSWTGARSGWRSTWWSCRPGRCWKQPKLPD